MILWGPPGVGKTTLARLMADAFNAEFIAISAVLAGVKDIREAVARAELAREQFGRAHDPLRRRSASLQQGAAGRVPAVRRARPAHVHRRDDRESVVRGQRRAAVARGGLRARSRCRATELAQLLERAARGAMPAATVDDAARDALDRLRRRRRAPAREPRRAARDGRRRSATGRRSTSCSSKRRSRASLRRFDKGGEAFYDQISALHKAVRGSDPDASLYWMCRMLDGGADPLYVGAAADPHGERGHRPRRSARVDAGARCRGDVRAARSPGRRARARAVRALSRLRAEEQRRLRGVQRRARVHRRGRLAAGAAAPAQCADAR